MRHPLASSVLRIRQSMRLVMLGTGPFAVPTLRRLPRRRTRCVRVVTRPPRGRRAEAPPMQLAAEELGLPVWQPETVNATRPSPTLRGLAARPARRLRLRRNPQAARARGRPARRHQPARLAAAEVSRRRAGAVGRPQRRRRDGQHRHPDDAGPRRGAVPGRRSRGDRSRRNGRRA